MRCFLDFSSSQTPAFTPGLYPSSCCDPYEVAAHASYLGDPFAARRIISSRPRVSKIHRKPASQPRSPAPLMTVIIFDAEGLLRPFTTPDDRPQHIANTVHNEQYFNKDAICAVSTDLSKCHNVHIHTHTLSHTLAATHYTAAYNTTQFGWHD